MDGQKKKCSYQEHKEINALFYCQECKVYMCNKCENFHSKLLQNHHKCNIDKDLKDLFTGLCQEDNHLEVLNFFCRNHNKLCCSSCICKIKRNNYGQHSNCNVCNIEDIKEEMKNNLKGNLEKLEEFSKNINESINKIKEIFENINKNKEELKQNIQKIFTQIRNAINNREDELLIEIDKKYEKCYYKEELIKDIGKMPDKIKIAKEKGSQIDKQWNDDNKLNLIINECININNIMNDINYINKNIKIYKNSINYNFNFILDEKCKKNFFEEIKNVGYLIENENDFINIGKISKIINSNYEFVNSIKNWINSKESMNIELLYRLSDNGEKFSTFHELCDNKGPNLILFHIKEGDKIGVFTPLSWDSISESKNDMRTFLFNLNKNIKYKKIREEKSICCKNNHGPYVYDLGCGRSCEGMKKIVLYPEKINYYFENGSKILPNKISKIYYDLSEVEIFKISNYS